MSDDKLAAYNTLYTCLMTVAKVLAPFAPFSADQLYHDLGGKMESVHLESFPVVDENLIDTDLEQRMDMAQKITSMVLALRRKVNIKVRQPLQQHQGASAAAADPDPCCRRQPAYAYRGCQRLDHE